MFYQFWLKNQINLIRHCNIFLDNVCTIVVWLRFWSVCKILTESTDIYWFSLKQCWWEGPTWSEVIKLAGNPMGSHHDFWAVWTLGGHLTILGGRSYLAYKLNKTENVIKTFIHFIQRNSSKLEPYIFSRGFFCDLWLYFLDSVFLFGFLSKLYSFLASNLKLFCWTWLRPLVSWSDFRIIYRFCWLLIIS